MTGIACVLCGMHAACAEQPQPADDESVLVVESLRQENKDLRRFVGELGEQVDLLTRLLADAKVEIDLLRSHAPEAWYASGTDRVLERERMDRLRVIAAEQTLGLVALDGGSSDGLPVGIRFSVVRGDRVIAAVRVVDVRDRISGAVVEEGWQAWPEPGDRLVAGVAEEK